MCKSMMYITRYESQRSKTKFKINGSSLSSGLCGSSSTYSGAASGQTSLHRWRCCCSRERGVHNTRISMRSDDTIYIRPRTVRAYGVQYSSVSKLKPFNPGGSHTLHTDRTLRPSCSRYIRARGAGPPEAIGEAGGRPRNRASHPAAQ